ncbi:MAG: peptide deformylase [Firmicutes bacterium]|nr:peptide deformylase [Bacillota bacterium]
MLILEIRKDGDPVLRQKAVPVAVIDDRMRQLATDMLETMYNAPGVGLAAPQVGVAVRLIVVDDGSGPHTLFNPRVMSCRGEVCEEEGCLSVPGMIGKVRRAAQVEVEAYDRAGRKILVRGDDLLAIILQHETDHLDGVLFTDKAESLRFAEKNGDNHESEVEG